MKITKTVLTLLAVAISSSAFAANSSTTESSYDVITSAASENIYEGARGDSARQALRSVDDAFYAGIKKSINDYESEKVLSNQLAMTQSSENIMPAVRETNISEMADRGTEFGPAASQIVKAIFTQANGDRGAFGYTTQLGNVDGESLNESLPVESAIRDGVIKVASEFKANEIAKAISEFNNLQELAVKESDPQVKALIKQAADLKLESYRVAASKN